MKSLAEILAFSLIMMLLFTACHVMGSSEAEPISIDLPSNGVVSDSQPAFAVTLGDEGLNEIKTDYFFDVKVTASSDLARRLAIGMLNHEDEIDVSDLVSINDESLFKEAWNEAITQNPLICGVTAAGYNLGRGIISINYLLSAEEQRKQQQTIMLRVRQIVNQIIADDMSDLEKEFAINNYLCDYAEYDTHAANLLIESGYVQSTDISSVNASTPYGVLVNGKGICSSFSGAFKLIADAVGLDNYIVTGTLIDLGLHSWNKVKIGNEYLTLDVTNNDMSISKNAMINIPDYIAEKVIVPDTQYLPASIRHFLVSNNETYEYYRQINKYIPKDELVSYLIANLGKSNDTMLIRSDYDLTDEELSEILTEAINNIEQTVSISYSLWLGVISIYYK